MAIVSAEVENVGWVLRLVVTGGAGGFSDYDLDPSGLPRLRLRSTHPGFVQSGGVAVGGSNVRSIVGTKTLRLPVNPASPNTPVIDEIDLGGGQRAVRIALSQTIYATDTGLTLDVLAGWRTGEGAASGIAVTNNSTIAAPIPIMRWAVQAIQLDKAPMFRLSLIVAAHHPNGFQPVAGVKFTLTDGTRTKTVWATSLATDNSAGDNLRCYTTVIDASAGEALTAGLLRADAEVYPWLGPMRSTDPAGTRSMVGLGAAVVRALSAENPLVLAHDPDGTRYGGRWVSIDPVNGTATASAAMVQPTLAAAKALAAESKPNAVNVAVQALWLANKSLPAANGQAAIASRVIGGAVIVLPAGVTTAGTLNVSTGGVSGGVPLRIIGDPDDPNPRANCIFRSMAASPGNSRVAEVMFSNLTIEMGQTTLWGAIGTAGYGMMDGVTVQGKAGYEGLVGNISASSPVAGWNYSLVNSRWWKSASGLNGANHRFGLLRNVEHSLTARSFAIIKNRYLAMGEDPFWPGTSEFAASWNTMDLGGSEDNILAYCDARGSKNRIYTNTGAPADAAGTTGISIRRMAIIGNLFERVGSDPQSFISMGEGTLATMSYNIIEGNTFAGERCNFFYSDPPSATVADTDTLTNNAFVNRVANNAFDWNANKQDNFSSPAVLAVRTAAGVPNPTGYRPQCIGVWSDHMGVGREGNYDSLSVPGATTSFNLWFPGVRSFQPTVPTPSGFTINRSNSGDGLGFGDYTPAPGSALLGRSVNGQSDVDWLGNARVSGGAAGAIEAGVEGGVAALLPDNARHDQIGGSPEFGGPESGGAVALAPADAFHGYGGFDAAVAVLMGLAPAQGWLMVSASDATVGVRLGLAPAGSGPVMLATQSGLSFGDLTISAAGGQIVISGDALRLGVAAGEVKVRVMRVGADERVFFARLD